MRLIKQTYIYLFFIGFFLIPFNDINGLGLLKEYANESAIYPWLLGGLLVLLASVFQKQKFYFPYKNSIVFLLFLFITWSIATYFFNFFPIQENYFKDRTGNSRFFSQLISLCLSAVFLFYYFWNIIREWTLKTILYRIRTVILYSFIFVYAFAILEFLVEKFDSRYAKLVIEFLNYLPLINKEDFYLNRLSSVSFEVPALGNYLIFIAGWMFSYLLTSKNRLKGVIPTFMVLSLVVLSGARAATVIVLIQFSTFLFLLLLLKKIGNNLLYVFRICLCFIAVFLCLKGQNVWEKVNSFDVESSISNKTRFGMQYASLQVFKENPIIGVGLGQNTFYKREHYPKWALRNNYEFSDWYLNEEISNFPPDFNLYTRLLAETGLIGISLFVTFLLFCIRQSYHSVLVFNNEERIVALVVLVSFIGFVINWLQIDYFRQFGFWLCLALVVKLIQVQKNKENFLGKL